MSSSSSTSARTLSNLPRNIPVREWATTALPRVVRGRAEAEAVIIPEWAHTEEGSILFQRAIVAGALPQSLFFEATARTFLEGTQEGKREKIDIHFKYGKSGANCSFLDGNPSLDNLRMSVMSSWEIFYRKEFHLECENRILDSESLEELFKSCKKNKIIDLTLVVVSDCLGFSEYANEDDYLFLEGILKAENGNFGKDDFDINIWLKQIEHAVDDIENKLKLYGCISKTCEASVREFISPILSLAALIAEDIMMKAEPEISGLRGNGPLDYLFLYKKFPIVITEVKEENINRGLAQNDAQLVAGRQDYKYKLQKLIPEVKEQSKKRKYLEIDLSSVPSYGIISSGMLWMFQRLEEGQQNIIHRSKIFCINLIGSTRDHIKVEVLEVVRHIVWILKSQKEAIELHNLTKKVRNEL